MSTRSNLQEKLYSAVAAEDAKAVASYLARGASANLTCSTGKTCLGKAAYLGNTQILKLLLDSIYSSNLQNANFAMAPYQLENVSYSYYDDRNRGYYVFVNDDLTPVNLSPDSPSCTDALEWDEEVGIEAETTVEDERWTELYKWYAQMLEQTEGLLGLENENVMTHESIRNGDMQDAEQRTASHYAAEQGHSSTLRLLSQAGCKMDTVDINGYTPLHLAAQSGHRAAVRVLLSAGADVNKCSMNLKQVTPLHMAALFGHLQIVEILLSNKASLETRDGNESTPLMIAVSHGYKQITDILLQANANPNIEDIRGMTPLCEAVWGNETQIVKSLIKHGARFPPHHNLLHYSVRNEQVEITESLLSLNRNCCINLRDTNGDTPLHIAVRTGRSELVKILLRNGASVNLPNSLSGLTVLHDAIEHLVDLRVFQEIFVCLQEYNVDLDASAYMRGDTPLFRAIANGRDGATKVLVKHGADVNNSDCDVLLMDYLALAIQANKKSLANLLVLAGVPPPPIYKRSPRPLSHIVRLKIRSQLRPAPLFQSINLLPIPISLKGFLMFEDED